MSFEKNEESDFDFSIIDKKSTQEGKLNFSVESLLEEHPPERLINEHSSSKTNRSGLNQPQKQIYEEHHSESQYVNAENGSFLQDLEKLEEELSFETQLYNVYQSEDSSTIVNSLNPLTKSEFLHAKSNSHLLTTKEEENSSQSIDDYGYLVIDFALKTNGNKKINKSRLGLDEVSRLKSTKLNTHEGTKSSRRLKLSSEESRVMEDTCNFIHENSRNSKSITKSITNRKSLEMMALGKLLSPPRIGEDHKSISREKTILKGINKGKNKLEAKESKIRQEPKGKNNHTKEHSTTLKQEKSPLPNHKSKSNSKTLLSNKSSKKTITSTTVTESVKHSNKSYTKSTNREGNAYSEYYGFEDIGDSERLVMKSNCIYSKSEKCVKSPSGKRVNGGKRLSTSKEKGVKMFRSPSPKGDELTMRFKKKKMGQVC